jgi:hypothetical protein
LAKEHNLELVADGGTNHAKWRAGRALAIVPRHREIDERLAQAIIRQFTRDLAKHETEGGA